MLFRSLGFLAGGHQQPIQRFERLLLGALQPLAAKTSPAPVRRAAAVTLASLQPAKFAGLALDELAETKTDTEALDLWQAATEIARLAALTRDGKASRDELSGSTITITSLGPIGGIATTPVINHPEVAIIGPNAIIERPVVRDGQVTVRKMMNISSSFDHRVVDGYDAALFIQRIKALLEHPALMFM